MVINRPFSKVSKWVITPISPISKEVICHLLTIDPNFERDIQVPATEPRKASVCLWNHHNNPHRWRMRNIWRSDGKTGHRDVLQNHI